MGVKEEEEYNKMELNIKVCFIDCFMKVLFQLCVCVRVHVCASWVTT